MTDRPKMIWAKPNYDGEFDGMFVIDGYPLPPSMDSGAFKYVRADEHDRLMAEKDAEIARLRAALLYGKAFAEDWIAEHGGIDGCDYSDRLAFENMCAALGDTDE